MDDSYKPLLQTLGQWNEPESGAIALVLAVLVAIPALLFAVYHLRKRIRRRRERARGYAHLVELGDRHSLNYPEQMTAERMTRAANLPNPAQVFTSIDAFDQAAAAWMAKAEQMPWREMDSQVANLASLRRKLGFRHIPPDRRPRNTRHLILGQKIYILAATAKGVKLLSAPVVDLDDLAIFTSPFSDGDRPIQLRLRRRMWAFFWSPSGGEHRFSTQALKAVDRPAPVLLLQHGDDIVTNEGRKIFSCDLDEELTAEWLPVSRSGRTMPSPALFEKGLETDALPARLKELSGSGFVLSADATFEINDMVRFAGGRTTPGFLEGKAGRVVRTTRKGVRFKFLNLSDEDRDAILTYVAPRISRKALKKLSKKAPAHA